MNIVDPAKYAQKKYLEIERLYKDGLRDPGFVARKLGIDHYIDDIKDRTARLCDPKLPEQNELDTYKEIVDIVDVVEPILTTSIRNAWENNVNGDFDKRRTVIDGHLLHSDLQFLRESSLDYIGSVKLDMKRIATA